MDFAVKWSEFNRKGELVTKQKEFRTEKEMDKFTTKLQDKDNFVRFEAYSYGK